MCANAANSLRLGAPLGSALLAVGLLLAGASLAQAAPLAGTVLDGTTLTPIDGATLTPLTPKAAPVETSRGGRYAFPDLTPGTVKLRIEADGYESSDEQIELTVQGAQDQIFILLKPGDAGEIIEIEDEGPKIIGNPGQQNLRREELTVMPGTRGDALQSLKSLPGVANVDAPGAGPGLVVIRGSAPEDSKITIDGIEVPLVYHFFGLQSMLPSEFIDAIDFVPGGFDAREGRATGGVINVATRAQRSDKLQGFIESSFINIGAFLEGPISRKHNLDFKLGLRRSTIDFILPLVIPDDSSVNFTTAPRYYDGQLRVDWRPNERHHFSSFNLLSYDLLSLLNDNIDPNEPLLTGKFDNEIKFTRFINSWRYKHGAVENKLTLAGGTGNFRVEIGSDRFIRGTERRLELRDDGRWELHKMLALRAGGEARLSDVDIAIKFPLPPTEGDGMVPNFSASPLVDVREQFGNHLAGAYLIADFQPTKGTRVSPGLRFDYFHRLDETTLHPRLNVRHEINQDWSVQASVGSYSRNFQQNETLPTYVKPELATQYVLGAKHTLQEGITASASAFYTDRRQLLVRDATIAATDPAGSYVNRGFGRSFGAEALLRVKRDNFFGWLAYTASRSDRVDNPLSDRRLFDFDQTQVFIAVSSYKHGNWTFGGRWTYSTGNPQTPILGAVLQTDINVYLPIVGEINSDRLSPAHQLDARIDHKWQFDDWKLSVYLDVTNVYANPRTLGFQYNFDYTEREPIEELPIVPALGIRGSF